MANVRLFSGERMPLEMHKVRIVQKLNLPPVEYRHQAMTEAGNNTFLLQNQDVFLDMLTDSGVSAMSGRQQAAMLVAQTLRRVTITHRPPRRRRRRAWRRRAPGRRAAAGRRGARRTSTARTRR